MGCEQSVEEVGNQLTELEQKFRNEHEREKKVIAELDARTKVPHILIELRNLGFVEIQGKDTGGIYARLDDWLKRNWKMQKLKDDLVPRVTESGCCDGAELSYSVGPLKEWNHLCDAAYCISGTPFQSTQIGRNGVFLSQGDNGENNMGLLTMQISNFMTHECGWTLQVCDGGNLGFYGEIREQQIKFKAPHPLNLIAPLLMIELRQVGCIEVNGPDTNGIHGKLQKWLVQNWRVSGPDRPKDICALRYRTGAFRNRGTQGENNMGMRTMELVDFMVQKCAWTMVTCNASNYGRKGDMREQQLVFRNDEHVQHGQEHILVELRSLGGGGGYIEVNGFHDAQDLQPVLDKYFKSVWYCTEYVPYMFEDTTPFCDKKYTVPDNFYIRSSSTLANNLGKRTLELAQFLSKHGWALQLCNGGSITPDPITAPNKRTREQQIKFTRALTSEKANAPLLMIEFRAEPAGIRDPINVHGHIEINGPNVNGIHGKLHGFITSTMAGQQMQRVAYCDKLYSCGVFRMKDATANPSVKRIGYNQRMVEDRLQGESNIGKWTMRLCDFMVDHVGEWDLIVCNSDNLGLDFGNRGNGHTGRDSAHYANAAAAREMQLVFRHTPGKRNVFMSSSQAAPLGRPPLQPPTYWKPASKSGQAAHEIVVGTPEELQWMQELLDGTFKQKATRDRKETLAHRFVAVQCLRSEHPELWDKFAKRRQAVTESCKAESDVESKFVTPKTMLAGNGLAQRCTHPKLGNPACQAYLLHGTNPTSAVAILGTSFKIDFAGKSAGTMFGPGIYLAESSSKADEYAADDRGGEYDGLYAALVCRAMLGRPFITETPGNYAEKATSGAYDCVLGDREKAVGTYREYIFFHEGSVYPEYAIFYRRQYPGDAAAVKPSPTTPKPSTAAAPPQLKMSAAGETWQYQCGGSWTDFRPDVQSALIAAKNGKGDRKVGFEVNGVKYEVDTDFMIQKNLQSGTERMVRTI